MLKGFQQMSTELAGCRTRHCDVYGTAGMFFAHVCLFDCVCGCRIFPSESCEAIYSRHSMYGIFTLQGTNISPKNGIFKMIFLLPRWDMLIPWRVAKFSININQM